MKNKIGSPIVIGLLVNAVLIIVILLLRPKLPPVVPLFYGNPEGEDQLAPSIYLAMPPIMALAVTAINATLIKILTDEFLKKVLLGLIFLTSALSTVTVIKILFLVGSF